MLGVKLQTRAAQDSADEMPGQVAKADSETRDGEWLDAATPGENNPPRHGRLISHLLSPSPVSPQGGDKPAPSHWEEQIARVAGAGVAQDLDKDCGWRQRGSPGAPAAAGFRSCGISS